MNKKVLDNLTSARAWLDKSSDGEVDTKAVSQALDAAEKASRDVDDLRERLAVASKEQRVSLLVLQETLKSAKHAQKAVGARQKATRKALKAKTAEKEKGKGKAKAGR